MPLRPAVVNVPDATPLLLREHHLLPLVSSPLPAVPLTEHPNAPGGASKKGTTHAVPPPPNLRKILGIHPGMESGWRAGTSTAPARRRTATLVVATVGMNESSRVSSDPMSPLPTPANAPRPTSVIVSHQVQRERACSAEEIHRQLTAHAVKTPLIYH